MKHFFFTILTSLFALAAQGQNLIGYMSYNAQWTDDRPHCGWYTFELGSNTFMQHTDDDVNIRACKGGTCAEGHLFAMEAATDSWLFPNPQLHIYNASDYQFERTISYGRSDRDHATKDFALNPANHQLYAVAQYRDGNTADGGWLQHYNLTTGEMTRVAHLPTYQHALAITADGTYYTLSENGHLNIITWDASYQKDFGEYGKVPEARITSIGATGYRLQGDVTYANSLCFDYRSGRLFWAASAYPDGVYDGTDTLLRGIMEIDLGTGRATVLQTFPDNIIITALAVPYLGLDHPDDIQDLDVRTRPIGSEYVSLTFTIPAVTYGQQPYPTDTQMRVHPIIDGRDYYTAMLEAGYIGEGSAYPLHESDFLSTPGTHWGTETAFRLSEQAYHTVGAFVEDVATGAVCQTEERRLWVGWDAPCRPEGVTVNTSHERTVAAISWQPVTEGIHGGDLDISSLRYIVTRRSDNGTNEEDVAIGITDTEYVDAVDVPMSYTRYEVMALTDQNISEPARSSYVHVGTPRPLPFYSTFSYIGEFHQFITIDANDDGWDDWETPSWYFDSTYGAAFCYLNRLGEPQDDWLVTPALQLEAGQQYEVIFQSYGYYGLESAPCHLQLATGPYAEPEALSHVIYDKKYAVPMPVFPYEADDVLTENVIFTAAEGDAYIGFHNITNAFDHMSLDNIYIRPAEGAGALLPECQTAHPLSSYSLSGRSAKSSQNGIIITDGRKHIHY